MLISATPVVLLHLIHGLALAAVAIALLGLARVVFAHTTTLSSSDELADRANPAYAIYLGGFLTGTAIALAGTLFGRNIGDLQSAIGGMLIEGLLLIALLRLSVLINDRVILHGFSLEREISEDQNCGAAFCVAGSCVASGLVLNGALTGYSANLGLGLRDTFLLWLIGQLVLVGSSWLYRRLGRFDIQQLIEFDNNAAAGLRFGAFLAGLGLVLRGAVAHARMTDLQMDAPQTLLLGLGGIVLFVLLYPLGRRFTLRGQSAEHQVDMYGNMSVSLVDAVVTLSLAGLISQAIQRVLPYAS